jgi:hypothetical protein
MPNIKPERVFNPFPPEGLVKAFEPFIRKEVEEYCKQYRHVPRTDMLIEAVRLAALQAGPGQQLLYFRPLPPEGATSFR